MKILVVNRNYFITGGPEQYLFRLQRYMDDCEFIPFSVGFPESRPTPYRKYFLEPPEGQGVYFKDFRMSAVQKLRYAADNIYSQPARKKLETLLREVKPDVAYFLNAVYFTDSIVDACHNHGVPIVWRMSDFHKVCASYHLLRDGKTCEACLHGGIIQALRYKCGGYQRSTAAALVKVAGMGLSRLRKTYDRVRYFVTPSEFTRSKMIAGGFRPQQIKVLPTLIDRPTPATGENAVRRNILYVGRLTEEKGVDVLLRAFAKLSLPDVTLTIAGDHTSAYAQQLLRQIPESIRARVITTGFVDSNRLQQLYRECAFFVVPSLWYENLPNVALEGMAHGRAPVVSDLGSLSEVVKHEISGVHFQPGDVTDLADRMTQLLEDPVQANRLGRTAAEQVQRNNSPAEHVRQLRALFASE